MILDGRVLIEIIPLCELYTTHRGNRRLMVFVHKGRRCVICEREGVLLLRTKDIKGGREHVDLYTEDFVLMTVDHIVPKAQARKIGWSRETIERLTNKQPMCTCCNGHKGDKLITNDEYKEIRLRNGYPAKRTGIEIIRQLVHNENIFNRNLEGVV